MAALTERYFEMPPFDQSGHFDLFPAFSQYPTDALLEDAAAAYAESANYDRFAHAAAAAAAAAATTTSSYPSSMPQMTSLAPASNASAGSALFSSPADYPLALAASYDGLKSEPGLATAIELPPSAKSWVSGASLPSAASSALGSPSSAVSQTLARSDPWSADVNGLGIAGIGRDGLVAATGLGQDVALTAADDNKGPAGFVGESAAAISSSSSSSSRSSRSSTFPRCRPPSPTSCSTDCTRRRCSSASAFVSPSHAPLRPCPLSFYSPSPSSVCPPSPLAPAYPLSPPPPRRPLPSDATIGSVLGRSRRARADSVVPPSPSTPPADGSTVRPAMSPPPSTRPAGSPPRRTAEATARRGLTVGTAVPGRATVSASDPSQPGSVADVIPLRRAGLGVYPSLDADDAAASRRSRASSFTFFPSEQRPFRAPAPTFLLVSLRVFLHRL